MQQLTGIGVSSGISIGKAEPIIPTEVEIKHRRIQNPDKEWQRIEKARKTGCEQLQEIYQHTLNNIGKDEAEIFDAHLSIMQDEEFFGPIKELIEKEKINAEWALEQVRDMFIEMFEKMDNDYMQQRVADIDDVAQRLFRILAGRAERELGKEKSIIIAHDLTPSDTAKLNKEKVLAFIMEVGGVTSHSAIIARSLGIPAVTGVKNILKKVKSNDILIIDGDKGDIFLNPDQQTLKKYQQKQQAYLLEQQKCQQVKGTESITKDGHRVKLAANIALLTDIESVLENDAEGIGLFRTEFLYMDRNDFPTEEEQFSTYQNVAQKMQGMPVIIRTLDIGGDKDLPYFKFPQESNPFLGFRAIRLCLVRTDLFKTQLRAILRASNYGNIKIMFPMISTVQELLAAKSLLNDVKDELQADDIPFAKDIKVGMMMETPAAAILSDRFAELVDFFSIGTNDLIQYTTAADRMNVNVANLNSPYNPSVLRLIKMITNNAHRAGIPVGIYGEAACIPALIPYFVGLGIDELSMSSGSILETKWLIQQLVKEKINELIIEMEKQSTSLEIEKLLESNLAKI